MSDSVTVAVVELLAGRDLSVAAMHAAMAEIMDGQANEAQIAALLTALRIKGETTGEIVGAVQAMQERCEKISTNRRGLLDTCGTGGDELRTFNISTATALVAAAAGIPVAKHGNRSVSSSSGSADVLEALGVNIQLTPEQAGRCLDDVGIGFCFAPLHHGAMKHAAPVRRNLGFRTIFNLLGPLTNPAAAEYQLVGANRIATAERLAHALSRLNRQRALIVCGADELDEVSLWGETTVFAVKGTGMTTGTWTPETFGLPSCRVEDLQVNSADESADVLRRVFGGESGPPRAMVLANAAAAFVACERCNDLPAGVEIAAECIDSGKAADVCRRLVEWTNSLV